MAKVFFCSFLKRVSRVKDSSGFRVSMSPNRKGLAVKKPP